MGEVEDLSVKAARLWLEFLQAQAKAAASAAEKLPDLARAWAAGAGVPPAPEAKSGIGDQAEPPVQVEVSDKLLADEELPPKQPRAASAPEQAARPALLVRANHRALKPMQKSLARRRMRRS